MPDIKYVEATLALAKDESKTLGLTLGTKKVTAGEKIPKAGKLSTQYSLIKDHC